MVGATGQVGGLVVEQALAAGHEVTAFVRRPDGLPPASAGFTPVLGSVVTDRDAFARAVVGHDAVVSAVGNQLLVRDRRRSAGGGRTAIVAAAHEVMVSGMHQQSVPRLVTMLAYGSGSTRAFAPPAVRLLGATLLRANYADLGAAEQVVTASGLAWTVCFVGILADGSATGRAVVSTSLRRPSRYRVARADLAAVLLSSATGQAHIGHGVVVGGPGRPRGEE